ncbi:AMP-binding protein, partial [Streptomyces venezuelae]|uniref:AMP-binding protein n=1 Tax=Streptomyces venezuelae TaxID=54571 RepID=UPI001F24F810
MVEARLTADGAPFAVRDGVYASGPSTLREFVEAVWGYGDRVFLVSEGGTTTYREFFDAACGLARRLSGEYGLRPGDRAVVAMRNRPEWQIAFWAAQLAGLVAVPLNAWWTEDGRVHDVRVLLQHALDLHAVHVLAAADHHVG